MFPRPALADLAQARRNNTERRNEVQPRCSRSATGQRAHAKDKPNDDDDRNVVLGKRNRPPKRIPSYDYTLQRAILRLLLHLFLSRAIYSRSVLVAVLVMILMFPAAACDEPEGGSRGRATL